MTDRMIRKGRTLRDALSEKRNVMTAVILRDMRSRFFDHGLGFLIVALWPLAHMLILLGIYSAMGRRSPYGDSMNVFFATGLIPTLAFMYISRFMSLSIILNKPMLAFPVVNVLDIMLARSFLEVIAAFVTLVLMFITLISLGDNPFPIDPFVAAEAYGASILLGVGVGSLAGVVAMLFPLFVTVYALLMIIVYLTSGTLFVTLTLPDIVLYVLSWNPVFHLVEWMREAYFLGYNSRILDKQYVVWFGITSLFLGFALERLLRMKMLEN
ncbi:ABC transporter permease [Agrobacterium rosae]|uniref:ABC transporter permease n=1 Tax=Agrobacterium rosae TaxID=1972867 RepID=UPI003BA243E7